MVGLLTFLFIGAFIAACCVFATFVLLIPLFYVLAGVFMFVTAPFQKN